jgi:sulfate transport system permease protein
MPGFGLTFGFTLAWLSLIVLIPLSTVFIRTAGMSWSDFVHTAFSARAIAAYRLSFGAAGVAATANAVFGLLVAWVLVRYEFPGRRVVSAAVDLPFALPTAVAGIALTALYAPEGWVGQFLTPLGIQVAYTPLGVIVAMVFIGLPFVVRSVEPVLAELGHDVEEAAASLGANRLQTFRRVVLPSILPALLTGFAMALARGVGEYGSIIFIAGNMPYRSEIAPLLIVTQLEQYNYAGATAIATVMMLASFGVLLLINLIQARARGRAI